VVEGVRLLCIEKKEHTTEISNVEVEYTIRLNMTGKHEE
jgi:hypothetical protein